MEFEIDNTTLKNTLDQDFLNRMIESDTSQSENDAFEPLPPYNRTAAPDINHYTPAPELQYTPKQSYPEGSYIMGGHQTNEVSGRPLAMVYAPVQVFRNIYEPEEALSRGTIFKELDFQWNQGCAANQSGYRRDGMRRG